MGTRTRALWTPWGRLEKLSRAHPAEPAHGAAGLTALSRAEVAALTPEDESSRLARYKKAASEESDRDSDEVGAPSFLAPRLLAEKTKAEEHARLLATVYSPGAPSRPRRKRPARPLPPTASCTWYRGAS